MEKVCAARAGQREVEVVRPISMGLSTRVGGRVFPHFYISTQIFSVQPKPHCTHTSHDETGDATALVASRALTKVEEVVLDLKSHQAVILPT